MLTLGHEEWIQRSADDLKNQKLNLSDGTFIAYDALLERNGPVYAEQVRPHVLADLSDRCQAALDRLARDIARIAPDLGPTLLGDKAHSMVFDAAKVTRLAPDFRTTVTFDEGARRILAFYDAHPDRQGRCALDAARRQGPRGHLRARA